jgi:hypothetical protein
VVKPKVNNETKEARFKRIASARTRRIIRDLRLLGNCSNTNTYAYSSKQVNKIFTTIEKEVRRVKPSFSKPNVEFSLEE